MKWTSQKDREMAAVRRHADRVMDDQDRRRQEKRCHKEDRRYFREKKISDTKKVKICVKCGYEKVYEVKPEVKRYVEKNARDFAQPGTKEWLKYHGNKTPEEVLNDRYEGRGED